MSQLIPLGFFCRQWREGDAPAGPDSELMREMVNGPIYSSKGAKGHEATETSHCPNQAESRWG